MVSIEIVLPLERMVQLLVDPTHLPKWLRGPVVLGPISGARGQVGTRSRGVMEPPKLVTDGAHDNLASSFTKRERAHPQLWEFMKQPDITNMPQPLKDAFLAATPDPQKLKAMHDKNAARMLGFADVPDAAVRAVRAPTLIVTGDRDRVETCAGAVADVSRRAAGRVAGRARGVSRRSDDRLVIRRLVLEPGEAMRWPADVWGIA